MTDLILTLNLSFPDYDFSSVKADDFKRLSSPHVAIQHINERLSEFALTSTTAKKMKQNSNKQKPNSNFLSELWKTIDNVIFIDDCIVFSYVRPEEDNDTTDFVSLTLTEGFFLINGHDGSLLKCSDDALWSFNYFFVNRSLKRILVFTCVESYLVVDSNENSNYDYGASCVTDEDSDDGSVESAVAFDMDVDF